MISHAERLQRAVLIEQLEVDVAERDFDVELQARLELFGVERFAGARAEGIAKFGKSFAAQRETRSHLVSAVAFEHCATSGQGAHQ